MPPADPRTAAPGAICPPVPDLPGGQATVTGFAEIDGIPGESATRGHEGEIVTRVSSSRSGGLPDEEVSLGFGRVCWEYRRSPATSPVRFCFDLGTGGPA